MMAATKEMVEQATPVTVFERFLAGLKPTDCEGYQVRHMNWMPIRHWLSLLAVIKPANVVILISQANDSTDHLKGSWLISDDGVQHIRQYLSDK